MVWGVACVTVRNIYGDYQKGICHATDTLLSSMREIPFSFFFLNFYFIFPGQRLMCGYRLMCCCYCCCHGVVHFVIRRLYMDLNSSSFGGYLWAVYVIRCVVNDLPLLHTWTHTAWLTKGKRISQSRSVINWRVPGAAGAFKG